MELTNILPSQLHEILLSKTCKWVFLSIIIFITIIKSGKMTLHQIFPCKCKISFSLYNYIHWGFYVFLFKHNLLSGKPKIFIILIIPKRILHNISKYVIAVMKEKIILTFCIQLSPLKELAKSVTIVCPKISIALLSKLWS